VSQIQQVQQSINMQVFNCFCFYQYYKEKDIFIAAGMETYLSVYRNHLEDLVAEFH
jgi:hypothetical protein